MHGGAYPIASELPPARLSLRTRSPRSPDAACAFDELVLELCQRDALHLPAFAAAEAGLFGDLGLEVEFVACQAKLARAEAAAAGHADAALTSVAQLLAAQTAVAGRLPVRFVIAVHRAHQLEVAACPPSNSVCSRDGGGFYH